MTTIACWNCGSRIDVGRGKTCACGAFVTPRHDAYVYDKGRSWHWKCQHCGQEVGPFRRRMDADESAGQHMFGETP